MALAMIGLMANAPWWVMLPDYSHISVVLTVLKTSAHSVVLCYQTLIHTLNIHIPWYLKHLSLQTSWAFFFEPYTQMMKFTFLPFVWSHIPFQAPPLTSCYYSYSYFPSADIFVYVWSKLPILPGGKPFCSRLLKILVLCTGCLHSLA